MGYFPFAFNTHTHTHTPFPQCLIPTPTHNPALLHIFLLGSGRWLNLAQGGMARVQDCVFINTVPILYGMRWHHRCQTLESTKVSLPPHPPGTIS
jgi:hypothetical protein